MLVYKVFGEARKNMPQLLEVLDCVEEYGDNEETEEEEEGLP
jgi:hypothetical protein